jgi:hypothetical protein
MFRLGFIDEAGYHLQLGPLAGFYKYVYYTTGGAEPQALRVRLTYHKNRQGV